MKYAHTVHTICLYMIVKYANMDILKYVYTRPGRGYIIYTGRYFWFCNDQFRHPKFTGYHTRILTNMLNECFKHCFTLFIVNPGYLMGKVANHSRDTIIVYFTE